MFFAALITELMLANKSLFKTVIKKQRLKRLVFQE